MQDSVLAFIGKHFAGLWDTIWVYNDENSQAELALWLYQSMISEEDLGISVEGWVTKPTGLRHGFCSAGWGLQCRIRHSSSKIGRLSGKKSWQMTDSKLARNSDGLAPEQCMLRWYTPTSSRLPPFLTLSVLAIELRLVCPLSIVQFSYLPKLLQVSVRFGSRSAAAADLFLGVGSSLGVCRENTASKASTIAAIQNGITHKNWMQRSQPGLLMRERMLPRRSWLSSCLWWVHPIDPASSSEQREQA